MSRPDTIPSNDAAVDARPAMLAFWRRDLTCAFANGSCGEWFGRTAETMAGARMEDLLDAEVFRSHQPFITGALAGVEQRFERTVVKADGSTGHLLTNYVPQHDAAGMVVGFAALLTDVTAPKTEDALRMAASAFQSMVAAIMITDIDGAILSVNPAFTDVTGYTSAEAIGRSSRFLGIDRQDERFRAAVLEEVAAKGFWRGEVWSRRKNGEAFLGEQTTTLARGPDGEPTHYVSVFNDVTDAWRRNEWLRHQASHDGLTDLPNRSFLMERLDMLVDRNTTSEHPFAVMFVDLDGFKSVNDRHGHVVGDRVLTVVASRLRNAVRTTDLVSRLAGDEFVVLLEGFACRDDVETTADRIVACLGEPMDLEDVVIRISASVGFARYPSDGRDAAALLARADDEMYAAKANGRIAAL